MSTADTARLPEHAPDIVLRHATLYDGTGAAPRRADIAIRGDRIVEVAPLIAATGREEIDLRGLWVTPGFIDIHTHYDAEIEAFPHLPESTRHGVTSVIIGNCSMSLALGNEDDVIDMFTRVESLSKNLLQKWLQGRITWRGPREYAQHLAQLPLGPNVAGFLGHSNLRLAVLGKERSLGPTAVTADELAAMDKLLAEALDAGFIGLSIDMLPWHRMAGAKYDGVSIPSQYASQHEYRHLANQLRKRGRVMQATPNANRKETVLYLALMSGGLFRRPLKVTSLAALDFRSNRTFTKLTGILSGLANRVLGGDFRFQSLASPFQMWADGFSTPIFEEFGSGTALMNCDTREQQLALLRDKNYRARFRSEWSSRRNRSFHRDFSQMHVVASPDGSMAGQSFATLAAAQGIDGIDYFLNALEKFGEAVRWHTVIANDRPEKMRELLTQPYNLPGFSDAGAHNRNLAFQHAHLCCLRDALMFADGLSVERAVHRLTGETAAWFGLDRGTIAAGRIADLCVIDPEKLQTDLSEPQEVIDDRFDGEMRMVTDSGGAVPHVMVAGKFLKRDGALAADAGKKRYGSFLSSTHDAA